MARERRVRGTLPGACSICGAHAMEQIESREVPQGVARLRFWRAPHVHVYPRCGSCGARPRRPTGPA